MKCALVFLLLIGISCQIGRGNCAPDTLYEDTKSLISDVKNKVDHAVGYSVDYAKEMLKSTMEKITPSDPLPTSIKDKLSSMSKSIGKIAGEAEKMVSTGINEMKNDD